MTGQGSAHGRFTRAVKQRNLFGVEMAIREMKSVWLVDALDILAEVKPDLRQLLRRVRPTLVARAR